MKPPIFIFGVPRSGTTLLRTILNCHPQIACGPEAPWLAHQAQNVMGLRDTLIAGELSYCRNFGVPPERASARIRQLVDGLFTDFAQQQGKARWAHKTPDDSMHVRFFIELFPEAKFIHLVRQPLDVALSTTAVAAHRTGVSAWHEQNLLLEAGCPAKNNRFNSVLRWRRWNEHIAQSLANTDHIRVSYEELVSNPTATFQQLFTYLDESFDPEILDYKKFSTIFPAWEWGSADVMRASAINTGSVDRWRKELSPDEAAMLFTVAGTEPAPASNPTLHSRFTAGPAESLQQDLFRSGLNELAAGFSLDVSSDASAAHAEAWWWFNGVSRLNWPAARVLDLGGASSVLPWFFALLGAKVTVITSTPAPVALQELRSRLKVDIDWNVLTEDMSPLPFADGTADIVINRRAVESNGKTWRSLVEAARVLKPGGALALSFEISPAGEFAQALQSHPAFLSADPPFTNAPGSGAEKGAVALLIKAVG